MVRNGFIVAGILIGRECNLILRRFYYYYYPPENALSLWYLSQFINGYICPLLVMELIGRDEQAAAKWGESQ